MIIRTPPAPWNSAHRPVEYVYDHQSRFISGVSVNSGNLQITITFSFTSPYIPTAGDLIAIDGVLDGSTDISGVYEIVSGSGSTWVLDLSVSSPSLDSPSTAKYIRLPEIELYAGYLPVEEYPDDLPLTLVATFTPENSPDDDVRFDVSEYLKSIFRIVPPVEGIDFNMFNRFRLKFDGTYKDFYMVLNSSIKTAQLNAVYVSTNAPLNSEIPPIVFGCGKTLLSYLNGNVVTNVLISDGAVPTGDYSPEDYTDDYFLNE